MAHIICIANPDAVMETRRLILQRAGHEIHAVHDLKEMERACQTQQYDLALRAHSYVLGIIGSWGDTLTPKSVLDDLRMWNQTANGNRAR